MSERWLARTFGEALTANRLRTCVSGIGAAALTLSAGLFFGGVAQEVDSTAAQRDLLTCEVNANPASWVICPPINGGIDVSSFLRPRLHEFWHKLYEP
jgi:hypothetical protein